MLGRGDLRSYRIRKATAHGDDTGHLIGPGESDAQAHDRALTEAHEVRPMGVDAVDLDEFIYEAQDQAIAVLGLPRIQHHRTLRAVGGEREAEPAVGFVSQSYG